VSRFESPCSTSGASKPPISESAAMEASRPRMATAAPISVDSAISPNAVSR
jgi:hypothetical protein